MTEKADIERIKADEAHPLYAHLINHLCVVTGDAQHQGMTVSEVASALLIVGVDLLRISHGADDMKQLVDRIVQDRSKEPLPEFQQLTREGALITHHKPDMPN